MQVLRKCEECPVRLAHIEESKQYYMDSRKSMLKVEAIHNNNTVWGGRIVEVLGEIKEAIVTTLEHKDDRLLVQAAALAGDNRIPLKSHYITIAIICAFFGTIFLMGLMGMAYYTKTGVEAELFGGRAEIKQHISEAVKEVEQKIEEIK